MKKFLTCAAMVFLLAGCAKQTAYDDTAVWQKLSNLEQRLSTLESSIQAVQSTLNKQVFVQKVQELKNANDQVIGITVTYNTGEVVNFPIATADPDAGPTVSIKVNGAGELCWAIDGKIVVVGEGENAHELTVYQYPHFEIDENNHLLVTVNGETTDLGLVKGDKGDTGDQGPQGPQGPQGNPGADGQGGAIQDGIIKSITVGEEYITIMLDDTAIKLPLTLAFKLVVEQTAYPVNGTTPIEIPYTVNNRTPQTVVDAYYSRKEFKVMVDTDKIVVTPQAADVEGDILLYADSGTGLTSIVKLSFEGEVWEYSHEQADPTNNIDYIAQTEGGDLEIKVVSNIDFAVKVDAAATWIHYVSTKASTKTITLTVDENTGALRTGTVKIVRSADETAVLQTIVIAQKAASNVIDLGKNGTANCYIVPAAGEYKFKAVKGNSADAVGTVSTVALLWETWNDKSEVTPNSLVSELAYADGYISFTAPDPFHAGNALIAAKDAAGTILWSWHIWMPESAVTAGTYGLSSTYVMMDRNLGALRVADPTKIDPQACGMFYQWGRKDPFRPVGLWDDSTISIATSAPANAWTVSEANAKFTPDQAVQNPTVFVHASDNWNSEGDAALWAAEKTIYDPCPPGYRVPANGNPKLFDYLTTANYDLWSVQADYRSFTVGTTEAGATTVPFACLNTDGSYYKYKVDGEGRLWTHVQYGTGTARGLKVTVSGGVSCSGQTKAYGLAVRCIANKPTE